ncbi:hypothetical protein CY34DRAFT_532209 [Suillus luteus UH-Slu-Lm8-n1]|uniref:Uncharacterized protein n=1 Tax=Suillus luteus UH-Slu-Lm8-n1 TaxID=930992 RepID=A0A0D0ADP2_9AGAM|nr:hypothetical protein CY34DRAFT_532209 [Suillus luteus UH-Slu-Lm8-n1]
MIIFFIFTAFIYSGIKGHPGPGLSNFHNGQAFVGGFQNSRRLSSTPSNLSAVLNWWQSSRESPFNRIGLSLGLSKQLSPA